MILTKVSAGHFTGAKGKAAHLALVPRDSSIEVKILSVVYGEDTTDHDDTSFDLKIAQGEAALTVVYGASDTGFVDLTETDGSDSQKLKTDKFNPKEPFVSIWIEGV